MKSSDLSEIIKIKGKEFKIFNINRLEERGIAKVKTLPYSIKILVENVMRHIDADTVQENDLKEISNWKKSYKTPVEFPFHPARVLMQDFTGVPAVVDLAAMRDAVKKMNKDPQKINPLVPVELVVDHSVQIDYFGTDSCLKKNVELEYQRNSERYKLLKWAQKNFDNFKVVPPNSGICHQVNLEHLGRVVIEDTKAGKTPVLYPDTLVGTDSHTPMINGIGVMGWGVGGIEAEAVMLGQPYFMSIPEVIGVRLSGRLHKGVTATDLVLTITELLRKFNVVEKFVEYFGPGIKYLSVTDRATISNMTPEYGATLGLFPVDDKTLEYLKITDRAYQADLTEAYTKQTGLFYNENEEFDYTKIVEFDLASVRPSLAGPARPQDRIPLSDLKKVYRHTVEAKNDKYSKSGPFQPEQKSSLSKEKIEFELNGKKTMMGNGDIVIAAITSCTNTSNPHVLIGAGLIARNAVNKGLKIPDFVKTSLAPGSKVVIDYLEDAALMPYFKSLGFHLAAFGCTTCIGNSGPIHPAIEKVIKENDLNVAAVLSGNRNFEARIHQRVKSNFLASPMLVVSLAIAGRIDIDLSTEILGIDPNGNAVYLEDIWPDNEEIDALVKRHVRKEFYQRQYSTIYDGDEFWKALTIEEKNTYAWDASSTYIKSPPYFENFSQNPDIIKDIKNSRIFLSLGDSVTTDHISPAGEIPIDYPSGKYLVKNNVKPEDFNSYGSRRGNHEVMIRGTFGNIRIKNKLINSEEGAFTLTFPEQKKMFNYEAASLYKERNIDLIVTGGKEYGTGSSRDWAAKGTKLLDIRAVIAQSYERIHRNNLVGMGVLPLMFKEGQNMEILQLNGSESYSIKGLDDIKPQQTILVTAQRDNGERIEFDVSVRLDTPVDVQYFRHGGILPYVLRRLIKE